MKTRLLILLFVFSILFPISNVFAPPSPDHQHAFNYSENVIIGKILSVDIISEPQVTKTQTTYSEQAGIALYKIEVEEYLKNPLYTNIMKVPGYFSYSYDEPQNVIDPLYEINEKVFLYIQPDTHETLSGYDLIIRSYESRSLDKIGSICDESETFYHKGECKEIPDCPPNTIFANGVCSVIDGGCEPDIDGNTSWCGPQYDYLKIILSNPFAFLFVFGISSIIAGIVISVIIWKKRK